jgi:hypothetical protein
VIVLENELRRLEACVIPPAEGESGLRADRRGRGTWVADKSTLGGRLAVEVWHYAGVNTFWAGRLDDLKSHPTVKPVTLVADALKDCTRRGDIVLDTFCGSGTTIQIVAGAE